MGGPQPAIVGELTSRNALSYSCGMTPVRKTLTFRIDDDLAEGLEAVWQRDHILQSEQIRVAIRQWLESRGVLKAERKRPASRKRS